MPLSIRYLLLGTYLAFIGLTAAFVLQKDELPKSGCIEVIEIGKSIDGSAIELCHVGGSRVGFKDSLLVIGSVHGNEPAGVAVVEELKKIGAQTNTDLWVIANANPDGAKLGTRQNKNGVDINRNFPTNWLPSEIGSKTYSGTNPASEPETQSLMRAIDLIKPSVLITIHQPYGLVDCSVGKDEQLDERLAALTGLPATCIPGEMADSPTNTYTGTISLWFNSRYQMASALALELEAQVSSEQTIKYAKALKNLQLNPAN